MKSIYLEEKKFTCIKSFPGFKEGEVFDEGFFYDSLFDPEKHPEYFKIDIKKTKVKKLKPTAGCFSELSSMLDLISPIKHPIYDSFTKTKEGGKNEKEN